MKHKITRRRKLRNQPTRPDMTMSEMKIRQPEAYNLLAAILFDLSAEIGMLADMKQMYGDDANKVMDGIF